MNIIIASFWIKAKFWCDIVGSFATLICVPALIVSGVVWVAGYGHSASVSSSRNSAVRMQAGEMSEIKTDLSVSTDSDRIVYQLRLVNQAGKTVYTYPESDVMEKMPEMSKIMIQVPNGLMNGIYDLYTDVKYAKNPIRTATVSTRIAKIEVNEE